MIDRHAHLGHPVNVYSPVKFARSTILVNDYNNLVLEMELTRKRQKW